MSTYDDCIQHLWLLETDSGDEVSIELWRDNYTVRVIGGQGEDSDGGRKAVEQLLAEYRAAGYRVTDDYAVNDPHQFGEDEGAEDDSEPDGKPDACPECGSPVTYEPHHATDLREGPAWLCTGACKWGEWITE